MHNEKKNKILRDKIKIKIFIVKLFNTNRINSSSRNCVRRCTMYFIWTGQQVFTTIGALYI